jgi:Immunity protein Imm1
MRLRWDAGPGLDVTDGTQLDRALDALLAGPAADRPLIAYLAGDTGALGLGLDPADGGVLLFAPADHSRPALHGTGAGPGTEDDVVFAVSGRPHQFSGRCRVPGSTVRAAARQYLATGELPDCVEWEPEPGLLSDEGQRGSA